MSIQIGQQAPDFKLRDTDKQVVTLSEQKGKNVLLLFFPLAFTSTCTKELFLCVITWLRTTVWMRRYMAYR